jgi:hypothetical protein
LNAAGLIFILGDGEKTVNNARKVVTKYPGRAKELGTFISKQILPYVPDNFRKVEIWDVLFNGAGSRLVRGEVTADQVLSIVKREVDLEQVAHVSPIRNDKAIPTNFDSIVHDEGRHVTGTIDVGKDGTILFLTNT